MRCSTTTQKKMFHLEFCDKREVDGPSPNMEKHAFVRALRSCFDDGVDIKKVVTDASRTILKSVRKLKPL